MKRSLSLLLLTVLAAYLAGGCASTPSSETEALASDILSGASPQATCAYGEIPRCMTTGSRINGLNPQASCECLVREIAIRAP
jgi:hypothetical protein